MEPRVHILLATYNGEKYLAKLLDSLLAQTYTNVCVYALDDGSTDMTKDILKEYSEKGIIIVSNEKNIGYPYSFFKLLKACGGADYYCFCDQDDVWFPEKVKMAVEKMEQYNSKQANLYFADFDYCDEDLNIIRKSVKAPSEILFINAFFQCYLWGFTAVFNETTRNLFSNHLPTIYKGKDYWIQILCAAFGTIIYDNRTCAKYRRHGANVSEDSLSFWKFQLWRLKHFWVENKFAEYHSMLEEFYSFYADDLAKEQREVLQLFQSKGHSLKKAFYPHRLRSTLLDEIMLRMVFLLHKL